MHCLYFGLYTGQHAIDVRFTLLQYINVHCEECKPLADIYLADRNMSFHNYTLYIGQTDVRLDELAICCLSTCYKKHVAILTSARILVQFTWLKLR